MKKVKNGRYKELLKNTGVLAIGNFSSKILVFLLIPLYTNILKTDEYGFYDLIYTTIQLLVPVLTLDVTDGLLRFALEKDVSLKEVVCINVKYLLIGIALFSVGTVSLSFIISYSLLKKYVLYIIIYYVSYMVNQYMIQFAKSVDKVKYMAVSGVIGTLTNVGLCVLLLIVFKMRLTGFFIANILGQLVPAVFLLIVLWAPYGFKVYWATNKELEKRIILYSAPLILTSIGWWLNNTSDKYIITYFKGMDLNGLLSVAYKIPSILTVVYGIFIQAWQISAIKEYDSKGSKTYYNNIFQILNIFLVMVASVTIILTRPVSKVIFKTDFYSAWEFVPMLIISSIITAAAAFIAPILSSQYNTKSIAASTIIGGIVNVILNVILLNTIGNQGVVVATVLSSFLIFLLRYKALNGIIESKFMIKAVAAWAALSAQAVFEVKKLYIPELIIMALLVIVYSSDIMKLFNRLLKKSA
jgi:O-antigen/teichoic acid export membrane protein